jgi:hypothetical protein
MGNKDNERLFYELYPKCINDITDTCYKNINEKYKLSIIENNIKQLYNIFNKLKNGNISEENIKNDLITILNDKELRGQIRNKIEKKTNNSKVENCNKICKSENNNCSQKCKINRYDIIMIIIEILKQIKYKLINNEFLKGEINLIINDINNYEKNLNKIKDIIKIKDITEYNEFKENLSILNDIFDKEEVKVSSYLDFLNYVDKISKIEKKYEDIIIEFKKKYKEQLDFLKNIEEINNLKNLIDTLENDKKLSLKIKEKFKEKKDIEEIIKSLELFFQDNFKVNEYVNDLEKNLEDLNKKITILQNDSSTQNDKNLNTFLENFNKNISMENIKDYFNDINSLKNLEIKKRILELKIEKINTLLKKDKISNIIKEKKINFLEKKFSLNSFDEFNEILNYIKNNLPIKNFDCSNETYSLECIEKIYNNKIKNYNKKFNDNYKILSSYNFNTKIPIEKLPEYKNIIEILNKYMDLETPLYKISQLELKLNDIKNILNEKKEKIEFYVRNEPFNNCIKMISDDKCYSEYE